ncbi:hypothetical protein [Mesorhizobium sp. 8]|uniref:hypothetical protein n=1 Tax=Mesorhizobium sp. 8 TaxID=2584466 RepID=UPI00111D0D04|nr:hypothetical protein [Mesorhizobium sp. 8]QDC00339.1 hypothetical protein FGU64_07875 [Mesorhizobium sp. 8]
MGAQVRAYDPISGDPPSPKPGLLSGMLAAGLFVPMALRNFRLQPALCNAGGNAMPMPLFWTIYTALIAISVFMMTSAFTTYI